MTMRKGFSLLELLVASLLLGMLVTILTMLFNQSSIAWRTGIAGISDLDDVRETVGRVRNEADNVYIWKNNSPKIASIVSIWRSDAGGKEGSQRLRKRAVDVNNLEDVQNGEKINTLASRLKSDTDTKVSDVVGSFSISCGSSKNRNKSDNYTVNVRSAGPDRKANTYDDIWSYPDDFSL